MDPNDTVSNSSQISVRSAEVINAEIAKYGTEFSWDSTFTLLPTPEGLQPVALFLMSLKNTILGAPDIAAVEVMPSLTDLTNKDFVEQMISKLVLRLRDARAQNLSLN